MNDIVKQLSDVSVENTRKTHMLLDAILAATVRNFPENEIRFNNSTVAFEFSVDNIRIEISRDLNRFLVAVRAFDQAATVAECVIDIAGSFEERYARFSDKDLKMKLAILFTDISDLGVDSSEIATGNNTASDGTPVEEVTPAE